MYIKRPFDNIFAFFYYLDGHIAFKYVFYIAMFCKLDVKIWTSSKHRRNFM